MEHGELLKLKSLKIQDSVRVYSRERRYLCTYHTYILSSQHNISTVYSLDGREGLKPTMVYFNRLETIPFFLLFTCKGGKEYIGIEGGGNTEQRVPKARVVP